MPPPDAKTSLDWFTLCMTLAGGLALFLFGLEQLSDGLKNVAGDSLKTLLTRLTTNRFMGALTGAVVTGILNSSSVTTVLVVSFVTAGIMTLEQSVAVIMGANIGSTVTAQLLAFNITAYALLPVFVGFLLLFTSGRAALRNWGMMIMGLGLVFYGMGVMGDAMRPLRTYQPFLDVLASMDRPVLGVLVGLVFTALVQSSAATVGIAIALAAGGMLSLQAGLALALGANIGTCGTALLASIGKPREAVRAAVVHIAFNVLGVAVWLPLIGVLAKMAIAVSPVRTDLDGPARIAAEVPRQIANANTLFNVLNTCLFIGFTGLFAKLATKLAPGRAVAAPASTPQFLDRAALGVPTVALDQARREIGRAGDMALSLLDEFAKAVHARDAELLDAVVQKSREYAVLDAAIVQFLAELRRDPLTGHDADEHVALMTAIVTLRSIVDVVSDQMTALTRTADEQSARPGAASAQLISELYTAVRSALQSAVDAVRANDQAAAEQTLSRAPAIGQFTDQIMSALTQGLDPGNAQAVAALRLQTAFVNDLRQIYSFAKRIARTVPR